MGAIRKGRDCTEETGKELDFSIVCYLLYAKSKKKWYKWTYKTETNSQTYRMKLRLLGEKSGGKDN